MSAGMKEVTLLWTLDEYSFHGRRNEYVLWSPVYETDSLEGTKWRLRMYPRGRTRQDVGYVSLFLYREQSDAGPEILSLRFQLSVLAEDGSVLASREYDKEFKIFGSHGDDQFMKFDQLLSRQLFPRDVVTVRCTMWRGEGEIRTANPICIRTRVPTVTITFVHEVDRFSALQPNQRSTVKIPWPLDQECVVTSNLYFKSDSDRAGEMILEIMLDDQFYTLCRRRISLLGSGRKILSCEDDNRFDVEWRNICYPPLPLTKQDILNKKSDYLAGGTLRLLCECIFSSNYLNEVENAQYEMPTTVANRTNCTEPSKSVFSTARKASTFPSVSDDMKELYLNQCLSDVELKTETRSFPSHKSVLCARSAVFWRMWTSDMREKNTTCIRVDDLEDDVLHRFLTFLYSDSVQELEWTLAIRLYYAADKYEVGRLKALCSSFLLEHLSPNNVGELLLLADTHGDKELRGEVEQFILDHEKEVFVSEEWETFLKTYPLLAGETMLLKYRRKK